MFFGTVQSNHAFKNLLQTNKKWYSINLSFHICGLGNEWYFFCVDHYSVKQLWLNFVWMMLVTLLHYIKYIESFVSLLFSEMLLWN